MKTSRIFLSIFACSLFLPAISFAQVNDVFGLSALIYTILIRLGMLFWALAVMFFVWGVVKFIGNANDTTAHADGKKYIMGSIIAFVVLVSLWGIIYVVLGQTLGITPGGQINYVNKNDSTIQ